MTRKSQIALLAFFATLFFSVASHAQEGYEHLSVFAHGSGRTYVINSIGLNSVGLNPALLDYDHSKRLEVRIFPISAFGLDAGSSFRNASVLGSVFDFSGGAISDAKLEDISSVLSNGKMSGRGDASIIGIAYHTPDKGSFAFTWTTHAALRTDIPQPFLDFAKHAPTQLLQYRGSYTDFDLQGLWYSEYALSYGKDIFTATDSSAQFKTFHLGAAVKYVGGIGILKLDRNNYFKFQGISTNGGGDSANVSFRVLSSYSNDFDPKNVPNRFSFSFLTSSQAGSGLGFDIGIAASMGNTKSGKAPIYLGASITDIGYIKWTEHAQIRHGENLQKNFYSDAGTADLTKKLKDLSGKLVDTSSFTTSLPTMFRLGAKLDLDAIGVKIGSFAPAISGEFAMGLTDMVGSLKYPRLGVGFTMGRNDEATLPLRFGTGFLLEHNATDFTLGVGTTLFHSISIDLASGHLLDLFSSASRIDLAFSITAAF